MMQAITIRGHVGHDGILKLEIPVNAIDQDIEAVVVVQVTTTVQSTDANGYPLGFFEIIDSIHADNLIERPNQGELEIREPLE